MFNIPSHQALISNKISEIQSAPNSQNENIEKLFIELLKIHKQQLNSYDINSEKDIEKIIAYVDDIISFPVKLLQLSSTKILPNQDEVEKTCLEYESAMELLTWGKDNYENLRTLAPSAYLGSSPNPVFQLWDSAIASMISYPLYGETTSSGQTTFKKTLQFCRTFASYYTDRLIILLSKAVFNDKSLALVDNEISNITSIKPVLELVSASPLNQFYYELIKIESTIKRNEKYNKALNAGLPLLPSEIQKNTVEKAIHNLVMLFSAIKELTEKALDKNLKQKLLDFLNKCSANSILTAFNDAVSLIQQSDDSLLSIITSPSGENEVAKLKEISILICHQFLEINSVLSDASVTLIEINEQGNMNVINSAPSLYPNLEALINNSEKAPQHTALNNNNNNSSFSIEGYHSALEYNTPSPGEVILPLSSIFSQPPSQVAQPPVVLPPSSPLNINAPSAKSVVAPQQMPNQNNLFANKEKKLPQLPEVPKEMPIAFPEVPTHTPSSDSEESHQGRAFGSSS